MTTAVAQSKEGGVVGPRNRQDVSAPIANSHRAAGATEGAWIAGRMTALISAEPHRTICRNRCRSKKCSNWQVRITSVDAASSPPGQNKARAWSCGDLERLQDGLLRRNSRVGRPVD